MSSTLMYFVGGAALGLVIPPLLLLFGLRSLVKGARSKVEQKLPPPPLPVATPPEADFTLAFSYLDGEEAVLEEWRGEVLVLNFWATWCPGCVLELPHLAELARQGVEVLCLSDEPIETLRVFVEKRPELKDLPIGTRAKGALPSVYQARGIPNTCIISPGGQIAFSHCGGADWGHASVLNFVRGLEGGAVGAVEPEESGCSDGFCPVAGGPAELATE